MNSGNKENQLQEAFDVDTFRPQDAEGLVSLFRAVYGEHYPIALFYDPAAIIAANAAGTYYSIITRTVSGKVVAAMHLFRSAPHAALYEVGVGLVSKEYRNAGINTLMLEYLYETFVPSQPHIEEVFGEAVCNHIFMQKSVIRFRFVETAMEIALMPAAAYTTEGSATGRVATLDAFRCYRPKPHRIHLPEPYAQDLKWIYSRLDDARDIVLSEGRAPAGSLSRISLETFDFAQVARFAVHEIGADFSEVFSGVEARAVAGKAVILQAWLDLTTPWVGAAVNILREKGYFFGGALPRWFDGDGLLLQKLLCPPDFDGIVLYSETARQLLEIIRRDWQRADAA